MPRPASFRLVFGSVSAVAILTFAAACSQPASFATVDLARGNGGQAQPNQAQAFNSANRLPVYQPTALNGPQSFRGGFQQSPRTQFGAVNVPGDQVASLGDGSETFGILDQQRGARQFSPIASAPVLGRQDFRPLQQQFGGGLRQSPPAPFSQGQSQGGVAPFEPLQSIQAVEVNTGSSPRAGFQRQEAAPSAPPRVQRLPRRTVIEETALQPIPSPVRRPDSRSPDSRISRDIPSVGEDYATPQRDTRRTAPPVQRPRLPQNRDAYDAWQDPRISDNPFERTRAQAPAPERAPVGPRGSEQDFDRAALELLLAQRAQQERFSQQQARQQRPPAAQQRSPQQQYSAGLNVPRASNQYTRPYPLLRPGVWPELDNPGVGLVQAPNRTLLRQFAARPLPPTAPQQPIARASERYAAEYQIKEGDTLLTIAQAVGTTPDELAAKNGFAPEETIYIGQKLKVPAAPSQAPGNTQHAGAFFEIISADADGSVLKVRTPPNAQVGPNGHATKHAISIQRASIPVRNTVAAEKAKAFSWPIHGNVYRLQAGQIEIDSEGNAPVAAAAAGKVVHVERGGMGVLVVIEHDNGWRSLTVGLDYSEVRPGTVVKQGQMIGKSSRDHRVRFELRDANASVADALKQLRG